MLKKIPLVLLLLIAFVNANAQVPVLSDSAEVSLITNSPWDGEVYAIFGHSALRISDKTNNIDYAFNYGLFNFGAPGFIFRFAKGETDYMVAPIHYDGYIEEYKERGVVSYEQILNLTKAEKQDIWTALLINVQPENREYRYNFLYDNCSTRPRDVIEENINGKIKFSPTEKVQTFRDLIHECTGKYTWVTFGVDLVIGSLADKPITDRQKMFLPLYLKNAVNGAQIVSVNGQERPLLLTEKLILPDGELLTTLSPQILVNYPLIVGFIVLTIAVIISFFSCIKKKNLPAKIFDSLLFASAGIAGSIIFFLMFFSVHPAVNPNWNIVWLNPFQLIIAVMIPIKYFSKIVYYYHFINFAALSIFLLSWFFIPQQLEIAFIPFILALWLRSGTNFVTVKMNYKKINTEKE